MIRRYFTLAIGTLLSGVFTHITFFPILESWHNERMRMFTKFGIGIMALLPVFLVWFVENQRAFDMEEENHIQKVSILAALSYMTGAVFFGAGVLSGYMMGDKFGYPQRMQNNGTR